MQTSLALHRPGFTRETAALLFALLLAFILGGASGYLVRATSSVGASTNQRVVAGSALPCPTGRHVVVWYSAKTWGCVSNVPGE